MSRSPSFAGVVLAAGASSRMGTEKALLEYEGRSFLAGAIQLLQSACDFVVVVTGNNTELIQPVIVQHSAYFIRNCHPEAGQFSSLQLGLREALDQKCHAACVTLVDRPAAEFATLAELQAKFLNSKQQDVWAVVPEVGGRHGHPVIFGREMMEVFLGADPSRNARELEHQHQNRIAYITVRDSRVALNVNTPEEYCSLPTPK